MQERRRSLTVHQVVHIMFLTHFQGIQHQSLFQPVTRMDLFHRAGIDLFPETRDTTHCCRTYFFDCHLYILRTQINTQGTTFIQTIERPRPLKNMGKWQEIHDDIILCQCLQA